MDEVTVYLDELVVDSPDALSGAAAAALRGAAPERFGPQLASEMGQAITRSLSSVLPAGGGNHENSGYVVA